MVGRTISHYTILGKLGEGGMGVVYKAQDQKLQRTVALKFLPHHITSTTEDQERFLQEARAASALNHPNVCTVYAIEEEADQLFIAMEYVDGKTLRNKIEDGGLSEGPLTGRIENCIGYAMQIAEALQEAHGQGIIHRDIKTDNIMVNSKNQIKVMDFGLAKLKGSLKLTKTTSTVGTLSYMAPEQIQGENVDARSDLFSMGVVLYEMLTGHLPFRGEHEAAMMYSILNEEPGPIQHYLPDISSELLHIVNRALDKDPEDRYQSAHDMLIDLRRLRKRSTRVARPTSDAPAVDQPINSSNIKRHPRTLLWICSGCIAILAIVAAVFILQPKARGFNAEMKFHVLQTPLRNVWYGDLSVDGNWLVFPAEDQHGKYDVYMMNVAGGQPRRVTNDSCGRITGAALSPDGSTILYARPNSQSRQLAIYSTPTIGGFSREIAPRGFAPLWRPDGQRIGYIVQTDLPNGYTANEFWTSGSDGLSRKCEISDTVISRRGIRGGFSFSPDGSSVAWTRNFAEGFSEIIVRNLRDMHEILLTDDRKFADDPFWLPNGHIVFSSTRGGNVNLWSVPASGGEPTQLTRGSGPDSPIGFSSALNRFVYIEQQEIGHVKLADLHTGSIQQLTVDDRIRSAPSISADGRYVAFAEQQGDAVSVTNNLYVLDRQTGAMRKLTEDDDAKSSVRISPDGQWLLYCACRISESIDSLRAYLLPVTDPGRRIFLGYSFWVRWVNNSEFAGWLGPYGFKGSVEKRGWDRITPDSVGYLPVPAKQCNVVWDFRSGSRGVWIKPISKGVSEKVGHLVLKSTPPQFDFATGTNTLFYAVPGTSLLRRFSVPDGKDESIATAFPGIASGFGVRADGLEIVYTENLVKARYVAIENFLK
jgi:serine/threonine protein kinase/Tol biopolymer transport system component